MEKKPIKNLRVLIVEDYSLMQIMMQSMLEYLGCTVDTAEDGLEGLEKFKKTKYDLIFVDLQMPKMNGFELIQAIRNIESDQDRVKIIIMTASVKIEELNPKLIGMDDIISKPFDIDSVIHLLEKHFLLI